MLTDYDTIVPIQLYPAGRHLPAKVRTLVDRAVAALRARFGDASQLPDPRGADPLGGEAAAP